MGVSRPVKANRPKGSTVPADGPAGPTRRPEASTLPDGARPLFREVDLSRAVLPHTVRVTLRYRVVRPSGVRRARVWLAEDPEGQAAVCLTAAGVVCLRLQVPQRVYVALEDSRLHLNLWVVEYVALRRSEC